MSPGLLSSMTCHVSVQDELGHSLEFLLQRMGVTIASCPYEKKPCSDIDFLVEISLANPGGRDVPMDHCLLFTPGPVRSNAGPISRIRRLQPPFLASTLGPLLMEMALEWRLNTY